MKAKKLSIVLALLSVLAIENSLKAHMTRNRETLNSVTNASDAFLYQPENAADEENFFTGKLGELDTQEKAVAAAHTRALENKVNDLTQQAKTTNRAVKQIQREHAQLKKEKKENK